MYYCFSYFLPFFFLHTAFASVQDRPGEVGKSSQNCRSLYLFSHFAEKSDDLFCTLTWHQRNMYLFMLLVSETQTENIWKVVLVLRTLIYFPFLSLSQREVKGIGQDWSISWTVFAWHATSLSWANVFVSCLVCDIIGGNFVQLDVLHVPNQFPSRACVLGPRTVPIKWPSWTLKWWINVLKVIKPQEVSATKLKRLFE